MNANKFEKKFKIKFDVPSKGLAIAAVKAKTDHKYYDIFYNGTFVRQLKISHGSHEWGDPLLILVGKNLGLTKAEVEGIVNCNFGTEDFINKTIRR